jgi:hypothetical protein
MRLEFNLDDPVMQQKPLRRRYRSCDRSPPADRRGVGRLCNAGVRADQPGSQGLLRD